MSDQVTEAAPAKKERARGVGTAAREAIAKGLSNEDALAAVKAEFPDSKTTLATVSWYRNDMRKSDPSIPSGRELKKAAAAATGETTETATETTEVDPLG